jgi:hypothetical protein
MVHECAAVVCPPWRGSAVFHFMLHFTATAEHLFGLLFLVGCSKGASVADSFYATLHVANNNSVMNFCTGAKCIFINFM